MILTGNAVSANFFNPFLLINLYVINGNNNVKIIQNVPNIPPSVIYSIMSRTP